MVLHREGGNMTMPDPLERLIVQVDVRHLDAALAERVRSTAKP